MYYVALETNETERRLSGLARLLPTRKYKKGTRPIITGPVALGPGTDEETQWTFPDVTPTEMEQKLLLATVVEIGVKTIFRTHLYQFGGRMYHQQGGGPIRLRATGAIARVVMGDWDQRLDSLLIKNGFSVEAGARYVDDIRIILQAVNLGWRWNGREMEYQDAWKEEETESGLTRLAKTAEVLEAIMNSLEDNLKFTKETEEDFTNTLPTLH